MMLTYKAILASLIENKAVIKNFGVKKIGLFGSYIRNEQKSTSDIDILVEFEKGQITFDNYMDLKFFLEDLFKCKVDLVMQEAIKPDLKPYILGSVRELTEGYKVRKSEEKKLALDWDTTTGDLID
jgi:predicted nucleotidyltransferase